MIELGTRFGRYEIRAKLGEGGMGEVYLAQDITLDRKVALKILPERVASNELRMQRFVQEAKAASALNHPNILTIYEIGTEPGAHFIATEFIDGETLRQQMIHTPLSIGEAIEISLQVASALASAHAAGIIHRDIKPDNVMVRRDGIVKVLDFGLAKLTERWRTDEVDRDAATRAMVQTEPGTVMGTTAYMSPEQARGIEVDTRTDIWSLGVVLYEMVTGKEPFKSETASDTNAAILKTEPLPLSQVVPDVPFELERIVKKALQKDREERYQGVKDLLLDLKSLKRELDIGAGVERSSVYSQERRLSGVSQASGFSAQAATQVSVSSTQPLLAGKFRRLWVFAFCLLALILAGGWYWWRGRGAADANRFSALTVTPLVSRKNDLGESALSAHARFSPDGKFVAYASITAGTSGIWIKPVGSGEPFSNKSEAAGAFSPIWSPDGLQIAFLSRRDAQKGIWTMPAFGGSPTLVKSLESAGRELLAWSRSGKIYFQMDQDLYALNVASQVISQITRLDPAKVMERNFSISADEQRIAYRDDKDGQVDLFVSSVAGGSLLRVTNDKANDSNPVWTADGRRIIYSSSRNGVNQIFVASLDGRAPAQLTVNDSGSSVLDISPDGAKILYATARNESDLWSVRLDRPKETQLTSDAGIELWPDLSPDNQSIVYQATRPTNTATLFNCLLLARSVSADAEPTQLAVDGYAPHWSPDGKQIAFLRYANGLSNIWLVHNTGGDARQLTTGGVTFGGFTTLPYNFSQTQDFQWSADSRRLVYCANASGAANVWEIATDGSAPIALSNNTDTDLLFFEPFWGPGEEHVAWVAFQKPKSEQKKPSWSIWVTMAGQSRQIFQSDSVLGLVGWSQNGQELILKTIAGKNIPPGSPDVVSLLALPIAGGAPRALAQLEKTYFQNIKMAPAKNQIAFVTRQSGPDSVEVISVSGGAARSILTSNDNRVYFSDLVWSPDGKTIYYGKQESWSELSLIDNFK
jgi:serine/threonine protein kinase/Tol biopolymer transport system component